MANKGDLCHAVTPVEMCLFCVCCLRLESTDDLFPDMDPYQASQFPIGSGRWAERTLKKILRKDKKKKYTFDRTNFEV